MMKKYVIFLLFLSSNFYASDELLWQSAMQSYHAEDYAAATTSLLNIKKENAALFMLLSDCYKHIGQPIIAKMYRQKAFIHGSWSQKWRLLQENYQETDDGSSYPITQNLIDISYSIAVSFPLLFLQIIFLLCVCMLLFCNRSILRIFSVVVLVLVWVCGTYKSNLYRPHGIVLSDTVVRNFADETAPAVAQINMGTIVYYVEQKSGFYKLEEPRGWVRIDDIARIT